jgi:hypothetical protein
MEECIQKRRGREIETKDMRDGRGGEGTGGEERKIKLKLLYCENNKIIIPYVPLCICLGLWPALLQKKRKEKKEKRLH